MKVKIKKLESGGFAVATPFVSTWTPPGYSSSSIVNNKKDSSNNESDEGGGLLTTAYKRLISEHGLINDVNAFSALMKSPSGDSPFLNQNVQDEFIQKFPKINEIFRNQELWKNAITQSKELGGLNEIAIGNNGELYAKDKKGDIKVISMKQYANDNNNYKPLSVAEILRERETNPNLAFNQSIFGVAENAVGTNKIMDNIIDIVSKLGVESTTTETYINKDQIIQNYTNLSGLKKPTKEQLSQISRLSELINGPDNIKMKVSEESQRGHLKEAYNYIQSSLPTPQRLKLEAVAVSNGTSAQKLIESVLIHHTDYKYDTSYENVPDSAFGSKPTKPDMQNVSVWELFHNGKSRQQTSFLWNDPQSNKGMGLITTGIYTISKKDGTPIGPTTLNNVFTSDVGGLLKTGEAYYGSHKIDPEDLNKLVYNGSDAARVYFPTNADGSPNYEVLKQIKAAESKIDPSWSAQQVNDYYKSKGLSYVEVDKNKSIIESEYMRPFLAFYSYGAEGADSVEGNSIIKLLDGQNRIGAKQKMEQVFTKLKLSDPISKGWNLHSDIYSGLTLVPYRKDSSLYAAAMVGHGPKYKIPSLDEANAHMNGRTINGNSEYLTQ